MARRKGLKKWDRITEEGWLMLMGDTSVMSRLMMDILIGSMIPRTIWTTAKALLLLSTWSIGP